MQITELKESLINRDIKNIYVFYGEEREVQRVYTKKIAEISNGEITYIENLKEIANGIGGFIQVKRCYVCVDSQEILKSKDLEKDFEKISQMLGDNVLILLFSKVDKRSKLVKDGVGVEFEKMSKPVLVKHIQEHIDLSQRCAEMLTDLCEDDYGTILLEIDKIKHFANDDYDNAFLKLVDCGVINRPSEDRVFEFVDAVVGGHPRTAFELLHECRTYGESALKMITLLFTSFKHVLQVQTCTHDIAETTGLSAWEIRKAQRLKGAYSVRELVHAMRLLQNIETGIKTGQIEESRAVEYALIQIM